jgi:hypothetical protein
VERCEGMNFFCDRWFDCLFSKENIRREPFLHLYKERFFSQIQFENVKKHFVSEEKLISNSIFMKTKFQESNRKSFFLSEMLVRDMSGCDDRLFWTGFLNNIKESSGNIKSNFLEKINDLGSGNGFTLDQLTLAFRFVTEKLPYILEPHVDQMQKIAVGVVYVNAPKDFYDGGTQLYSYSAKNMLALSRNYQFIENDFILIPREENAWSR